MNMTILLPIFNYAHNINLNIWNHVGCIIMMSAIATMITLSTSTDVKAQAQKTTAGNK
jgi:hypothetical protein